MTSDFVCGAAFHAVALDKREQECGGAYLADPLVLATHSVAP
jgi:hypothetical protein